MDRTQPYIGDRAVKPAIRTPCSASICAVGDEHAKRNPQAAFSSCTRNRRARPPLRYRVIASILYFPGGSGSLMISARSCSWFHAVSFRKTLYENTDGGEDTAGATAKTVRTSSKEPDSVAIKGRQSVTREAPAEINGTRIKRIAPSFKRKTKRPQRCWADARAVFCRCPQRIAAA